MYVIDIKILFLNFGIRTTAPVVAVLGTSLVVPNTIVFIEFIATMAHNPCYVRCETMRSGV
ncbi:hypothetical protein BGP_0855 [Beggiatoa sp. PS]|nr:hypothetical protein BGP_0855 [Beggiatoa sp. PS]